MAEDTFQRIVAVENEIRAKLAEERLRVDTWLEGIKAELQAEYRQQVSDIKKNAQRITQQEDEQSKDEARRLMEQARSRIAALERVDDDTIRPILGKLLNRIVPRE